MMLTGLNIRDVEDTHIFQLHLKNFTTGGHHSSAQQPIIRFYEHRIEGNQCIASIDIAGPCLLVLLTWLRSPNKNDELFVYNWMTASLIIVSRRSKINVTNAQSKHRVFPIHQHISSGGFTYRGATFLSVDTFILTNMRENAIEFLRLSKDGEEIRCRWIAKLALPTLRRGSSLISMNCRTDAVRSQAPGPSLSKPDSHPTSAGTPERNVPPVHCADDKSIIQFRMYLQGTGGTPAVGHVSLFAFTTHRGELLRTAMRDCIQPGLTSPNGLTAIPWELWGPNLTRWSGSDETDTAWMAGVAGQRQIYITGDRPRRIHVRDYNATTVRKELLKTGSQQTRIKVVSEETVTAHQGCFEANVRSSLPFVEVISENTYEYDGVLMDEHHVVGLTVSRSLSLPGELGLTTTLLIFRRTRRMGLFVSSKYL